MSDSTGEKDRKREQTGQLRNRKEKEWTERKGTGLDRRRKKETKK
jgi:hypothetical protein